MRFTIFAQQLEQIALLLRAEHVAKERMALVATDNLGEVLLQEHARRRFAASEGSWWSAHRRFSRRERQWVLADFNRKVTLASEPVDVPFQHPEALLEAEDAEIFRVAHAYRNGVYHEGRHPPALLPKLNRVYFEAVGRAWASSFPPGNASGGGQIEHAIDELERLGYRPGRGGYGRMVEWHTAAGEIADHLGAGLVVERHELLKPLVDDLIDRVEQLRDDLQGLLDDGAPADRLVLSLHWVQFWEAHGADNELLRLDEQRLGDVRAGGQPDPAAYHDAEDAYNARLQALARDFQPSVSLDTLNEIERLAPRLASARTRADLLRRYRALDLKAVALESAVAAAAEGWDRFVQHQIDVARGK